MECWGASGGGGWLYSGGTYRGGNGSYVRGVLALSSIRSFYIYVGQAGTTQTTTTLLAATFNGGGSADSRNSSNDGAGSGGGATDIRLTNGLWSTYASLASRILVAAGGGGGASTNGTRYIDGADGGGLNITGNLTTWATGSWTPSVTQKSGYKFGIGENGKLNGHFGDSGGGGGWYGGVTSKPNDSDPNNWGSASGGTSFISGHSGCLALDQSTSTEATPMHKSTGTILEQSKYDDTYYFDHTQMIDGRGYTWTTTQQTGSFVYAPNPLVALGNESTKGHTGAGYARITLKPYD